jgi:hypothetical protein
MEGSMNVNENGHPDIRMLPTRMHTDKRRHPRHSRDAALPAALVRQRLNRERPTWLSDDVAMPSERVWRLLTDGMSVDASLKPWAAFQAVLTGLANAGWAAVHAERALMTWNGPNTPGQWWLGDRRGRRREFDRAWRKALITVRTTPADPSRAANVDPQHDAQARAILNALSYRTTHDGWLPATHRLLSTGPEAADQRVTIYAMIVLAQQHLAALPLTDAKDGLYLAAAGRSLALITNSSQRRIARRLRSLTGQDSAGERGHHHRTLVALALRGSRGMRRPTSCAHRARPSIAHRSLPSRRDL